MAKRSPLCRNVWITLKPIPCNIKPTRRPKTIDHQPCKFLKLNCTFVHSISRSRDLVRVSVYKKVVKRLETPFIIRIKCFSKNPSKRI